MGEGTLGAVIEALAKILHESGRAAVEQGKTHIKPDPPVPFAEWDELAEDAREGRRMMADYLIEHANEVVELLEATLPVSVDTTAPPPPEAGNKGHVEGAV